MPDLLTTAEAAALLTERGRHDRAGGPVKATTVKRWCQRGLLPARLLGSGRRARWVITRAALDAFEPPPQGRPRTRP